MKKTITIIFACCMILSLFGCGSKQGNQTEADGSSQVGTEAAVKTDTGTETETDTAVGTGVAQDAVYTSDNPLILKMSFAGNTEDTRGQAFQMMADNLKERTGGAVICELYPNNELGAPADILEMQANGMNLCQTLSADFTCDYGCPDMMLCNIFYTFNSIDKTLEFSNSELFKGMCDKLTDNGVKVLNLAWVEAPRHLMTTRPIQSVADMKGLKVRIPGFVYNDFWEACGGVGVSVGLQDAYSSLSTGILEATETTLNSLYNYGIQEVCPYCTLSAHTTAPGCFIMSNAIWESMGEDFQKIMEEEAYNCGVWYSEQDAAREGEFKQKMEDEGVTFYEFSDEDKELLKQTALEQVNSYVETYNLTPGLYEEIVELLAD